MEARYQPIENYGIIGNMRTAALVGMDGSIDWLCLPHFDSPSVFAAILDDRKGGRFRITPAEEDIAVKQLYWPDTNVLITRFLAANGVGEIIDYMPIGERRGDEGYHGLIRRVRVVRGSMQFHLECHPAFNYARDSHEAKIVKGGAKFLSKKINIALASDQPLKKDKQGVCADFVLNEGQATSFELHALKSGQLGEKIGISDQ